MWNIFAATFIWVKTWLWDVIVKNTVPPLAAVIGVLGMSNVPAGKVLVKITGPSQRASVLQWPWFRSLFVVTRNRPKAHIRCPFSGHVPERQVVDKWLGLTRW